MEDCKQSDTTEELEGLSPSAIKKKSTLPGPHSSRQNCVYASMHEPFAIATSWKTESTETSTWRIPQKAKRRWQLGSQTVNGDVSCVRRSWNLGAGWCQCALRWTP